MMKKICCCCCCTVFCVLLAIALKIYFIPIIKYNKAIQLYRSENYDEAISAFSELNGFKDSKAQIENCYIKKKAKKSITISRISKSVTHIHSVHTNRITIYRTLKVQLSQTKMIIAGGGLERSATQPQLLP